MAKRGSKKDLVPVPIGIRGSGDTLCIKLETEYREAVGLARVEALLDTDRGFCLISAFDPSRSFRDNQHAFMHMPRKMQELTGRPELGGFWLIAHWVEASASGGSTPNLAGETRWSHSLVYSWLFVQPSLLDDEEWFRAATLMAQAHQQDFFLLRTTGNLVADLHGADGGRRRPVSGVDAILSEAKDMTCLRSRVEMLEKCHCAPLANSEAVPIRAKCGSFAVHHSTATETSVGPKANTLYAAKPHCNSSSWLFAVLNVWKSD